MPFRSNPPERISPFESELEQFLAVGQIVRPRLAAAPLPHARLVAQQRAQVAVAVLVLNFLHFLDDVVGPLFEPLVARGGIHQAHAGQIVSGDMPGELPAVDGVPAAVAFRLGLQAGALAIAGHHAIGLQLEQIFRRDVLRMFERPAGEPHGGQRQRSGDIGNCRSDRIGNCDSRRTTQTPQVSVAANTVFIVTPCVLNFHSLNQIGFSRLKSGSG